MSRLVRGCHRHTLSHPFASHSCLTRGSGDTFSDPHNGSRVSRTERIPPSGCLVVLTSALGVKLDC